MGIGFNIKFLRAGGSFYVVVAQPYHVTNAPHGSNRLLLKTSNLMF